jgi:hypothetical protein
LFCFNCGGTAHPPPSSASRARFPYFLGSMEYQIPSINNVILLEWHEQLYPRALGRAAFPVKQSPISNLRRPLLKGFLPNFTISRVLLVFNTILTPWNSRSTGIGWKTVGVDGGATKREGPNIGPSAGPKGRQVVRRRVKAAGEVLG